MFHVRATKQHPITPAQLEMNVEVTHECLHFQTIKKNYKFLKIAQFISSPQLRGVFVVEVLVLVGRQHKWDIVK